MGLYITKPITDKDSCDEEYKYLKCGSCSMQGWRTGQEDAHNAILDFDKNISLFAVYDGHGGHEVAEYTAAHFPDYILNHESYKNLDFHKALTDGFMGFDEYLLEPDVMSKLKKMAGSKKGEPECESTDSYDGEEIEGLKRDAVMSLDEVIAAQYATDESILSRLQGQSSSNKVVGKLRSKRLQKEEDGESVSNEPQDDTKDDSNSEEIASSNSNDLKPEPEKGDEISDKTELVVSSDANTDSKVESSSPKKEIIMNGKIDECSDKSDLEERTDTSEKEIKSKDSKSEECADSDGNTTQNGSMKVVGRRIVPTPVSQCMGGGDSDDCPAYTGKGKSGGKGGKVKGASANTTTKLATQATSTDPSKIAVADINTVLVAAHDFDSDDEDDNDETFAVESSSSGNEDLDDDDNESSDEAEEDESLECEEDSDNEEMDSECAKVYDEFYTKMKDGPGFDSGCTACVALLHNNTLYVANAGDSRCVVSRGGVAMDMSVDHKPEDELETNRIIKAGGTVTRDGRVNGGLNLSRALGDHGYKQNYALPAAEQMISALPDLKVAHLSKQDDFIMIACDGIWNSLTSQEAIDFVAKRLRDEPRRALSGICEELFDHCLAPDALGDGTGCDNMTCIIITFKDKSVLPDAPPAQEETHKAEVDADKSSEDKKHVNGTAEKEALVTDSKDSTVAADGEATKSDANVAKEESFKESQEDVKSNGSTTDDSQEDAKHNCGDSDEPVSECQAESVEASSKTGSAVKRSSDDSKEASSAAEDDRPGKRPKLEDGSSL